MLIQHPISENCVQASIQSKATMEWMGNMEKTKRSVEHVEIINCERSNNITKHSEDAIGDKEGNTSKSLSRDAPHLLLPLPQLLNCCCCCCCCCCCHWGQRRQQFQIFVQRRTPPTPPRSPTFKGLAGAEQPAVGEPRQLVPRAAPEKPGQHQE